jgi:hypothetical protein
VLLLAWVSNLLCCTRLAAVTPQFPRVRSRYAQETWSSYVVVTTSAGEVATEFLKRGADDAAKGRRSRYQAITMEGLVAWVSLAPSPGLFGRAVALCVRQKERGFLKLISCHWRTAVYVGSLFGINMNRPVLDVSEIRWCSHLWYEASRRSSVHAVRIPSAVALARARSVCCSLLLCAWV